MDVLTVALNSRPIARLLRQESGAMTLQYRDDWLADPGARALSLSLPLHHKSWQGQTVYDFFANLLPDSDAVMARIQRRFQIVSQHPFDILACIGRDCVGAIQIFREEDTIPSVKTVVAEPILESDIASILRGYQTAPLGMAQTNDFRISLAGAQEKTALLWYRGQWCRPLAATPTSHIFKLPIGIIQHNEIDLSESCENEWLCLQIAKAFGLPAANAEMASFGEAKALIVERFDRRWSTDGQWLMRLPQEDFCQALGIASARKYEADGGPGIAASMSLLAGSLRANEDRETFFKTQILFWLLAAIDGHAKNFSIAMLPGSAYAMTPLYDILSAHPVFATRKMAPQRVKMAMALQGKNRHYNWSTIQPRHFLSTAKQVGFSEQKAQYLMNTMADATAGVIEKVSSQLPSGFPAHISEPVLAGLATQAAKLQI